MISGFNTDIEFDGIVYHVQTEDKGAQARKVISLVYDGGTILASKRTSYDEISDGQPDENALAERLQRQHKLICAAVRAGRILDLKQMTSKARGVPIVETPEPAVAAVGSLPASVGDTILDQPIAQPAFALEEAAPTMPAQDLIETIDFEAFDLDEFGDGPIFDAVSIIEDEVFPDEGVAVVSELSGRDRPANSKLSVELLGDLKFKGGDRMTVNIMVCRGTDQKVIVGAQIMIKVLGSSFRPVIFHARTDSNGLASVHLQLPRFQAGRAALLVRAMDEGEEIELRRVVTPG